MDTNDISKFKQLFIDEATTLLNSMEGIILELENNPDNFELIQEVFRVMHTIKGVSGMYGFDGMSELTHSIENIYDKVRNGLIKLDKDILDLTLKGVDQLFALINDQHIENIDNIRSQKELLAMSEQIINKVHSSDLAKQFILKKKENTTATYNIILHTPQSIVDRRINVFYAIKDLADIGEIRSINRLPSESADEERWSIFVVGNTNDEMIEDALMFVYEYCIIRKVADYDIFNNDEMDAVKKELTSAEISASSSNQMADNGNIQGEKLVKGNRSQSTIESIRNNMNRVSVDSEKLDHLMYLVSELITTSSQLKLMTSSKLFDDIRSQMEKLDKLSTNFRNNALEIRLIPIRDITPKFNRLVRDISKELGKDVEFITEGMETELDKSSIDMIAEPLVHMLRNALDHGIELPEERLEKGKLTKGIIKLKAYNSGNNIYIEVSDDGKGLIRKNLERKAIENGLISKDDRLSDDEVFNLICHSGFSTAQEVTSISGRGVGMDVVRQKIAEMRGELVIKSRPDKGTTFTIKLQQSIAIMDTLLVSSAQMKCLLPLSDIEVCSQLNYNAVKERVKHGTIGYEKELIPFVSLREIFDLNANMPNTAKMIIINKNGNRMAIFADEIIGQHQAVLKPMGELVKNHREFSAASIMGNGEIAFLIDTNAFKYSIYN